MSILEISKKLSKFGTELLEKRSLQEGLPLINSYIKELIGADRVSLFLHDKDKDELWTFFADGVDKIIMPSDKGIVGETLAKKEPIIANDLNKTETFYDAIDRQTGYRTYNIITAPIYDSTKEVVGVLEALNKEGGFENQDKKLMQLFAHYISSFVELIVLERK